jgi:AcrR family transcriptional regulator
MSRQPSHEVRAKILKAALHVFSEKGYKETTVREIARVANVAVGGLYPYFGSKEQLYTEVLQEGMEHYNERIRPFRDMEPEEAIRRYIDNHFAYMAEKKEIVSRHFKDYDVEFARTIRSRFFDHQKEFLETIIRRGARDGTFAIAEPGRAALFILCLLKGALFYDLSGMTDLARSGEGLCRQVLGVLLRNRGTTGILDRARSG